MPPIALSAVPTFVVHDVAAAVGWYIDRLGFAIGGTFPERPPYAYASIHLGAAEVMFLALDNYQKPDLADRRPEGIWDAYIRMNRVDLFYERVREQPFIHTPLTKRPYGDTEFTVRDPFGYIVVFGGGADL